MKGRLISSDPYRQQFLVERAVSFSHRQRDCSELISVLPRHTLQQIDGFGGSFTEGAGVVFNSMSEKTKAQFLSLYFSAQEHNYTLARMPIQSCDFSWAITRMSIPALTCSRDGSPFPAMKRI